MNEGIGVVDFSGWTGRSRHWAGVETDFIGCEKSSYAGAYSARQVETTTAGFSASCEDGWGSADSG